MWTDVRDRGIGQDLMLLIECDVSRFLPETLSSINTNATSRFSTSKFNHHNQPLDVISVKDAVQPLFLDFAFEHDLGIVETTSSGPMPLNLWVTATNLSIQFDEPRERVSMAACLSPAFYSFENDGIERSGLRKHLLRWVEWREHMRTLGVERVNWYARNEDMKDFADVYNDIQGTKDIFR